MVRQEVITLPIAPGVRSQLLAHGFYTIADLQQAQSASHLAEIACLTHEDAEEVLSEVPYHVPLSKHSCTSGISVQTAEQLLATQQSCKRIMTFCKELDDLLGGGVACGHVTEFVGVPGVGKTQLGMQLCVDVQIPDALGGVGGTALYIDTEGSFMVDRVMDIATAASKHVAAIAKKNAHMQPAVVEAAKAFNVPSILSNIHVMRARDSAEQLACLNMMDDFLHQHPEVRLVVIDSITFHFRQDVRDMGLRARVLTGIAQQCMALAEAHNLAFVFMNQVTTRLSGESAAHLVPALGESWGHAASTRVILHWEGPNRLAYMYKSPSLPCATVPFAIKAEGVRSVAKS